MIRATFTQKFLLIVLMAFAAACLVQFYKYFVKGAMEDMESGVKTRTEMPAGR